MPSSRCLRLLAGLALWFLLAPALAAQPAAPPPPERYDATLRFRIRSAPPVRRDRLEALLAYLKRLGFEPSDDVDEFLRDPDAEFLHGSVPSRSVQDMLHETAVRTILLVPAGAKLPADGLVTVELQLQDHLNPTQQRLLSEQARERLVQIGFRESVGYDHRGFTRMVGRYPVGDLNTLLKNLRDLPGGWFLPRVPTAEQPSPLRAVTPIRVVTVRPEPAGVKPAVEPPAPAVPAFGSEFLTKIDPDLSSSLGKAGTAPIRVEAIVARPLVGNDLATRSALMEAAPGLTVEGRFGQIVTVVLPANQVNNLAAAPFIVALRLPVFGRPSPAPAGPVSDPNGAGRSAVLGLMHLDRLHRLGVQGQGVRVAVISGDFAGYRNYLGHGLGAQTRLVDLTAERSPEVQPDPMGQGVGDGTRCALAVAAAAPGAEIVLVRIDSAAAYELLFVARLINGGLVDSEPLLNRAAEVRRDEDALAEERRHLLEQRQKAFSNYSIEEPAEKARRDVVAAEQQLRAKEAALSARAQRLLALQQALSGLRGTQVVACPLLWNEGHPLDGLSALSRYLDDPQPLVRPGQQRYVGPLWFQSGGDTRGQSWSGRFLDSDGNGVLEFRPPGTPLPPGRWTHELNFLTFAAFGAAPTAELPAAARVRLTVQWREPHDPGIATTEEDLYREPLAQIRLLALRQRDPSGRTLPADDFEIVGQPLVPPRRILDQPSYAVYEQVVEFTAPAAGRYAVRVEGRYPASDRPRSVPSIAASSPTWELRLRLFVELTANRGRGRVLFEDGPLPAPDGLPGLGGVGLPGDARRVVTVGAADNRGVPRPYAALGAGPGLQLMLKPVVFAPDALPLGGDARTGGNSVSTGLAAGLGACLYGAGGPRASFNRALGIPEGTLLRVPVTWLRQRASPDP